MKKVVLVFLSQEYADWEASYACPALNDDKSNYIVKTVSLKKETIKSIGGLSLTPDYTIDDFPDKFSMLILIGGMNWVNGKNDEVKKLVDYTLDNKIPLAAICDATTYLAKYNYLDNVKHTGNSVEHIKQHAPNYKGQDNYIEKQCVSADNIVTANGSAALEFTKEILFLLEVSPEDKINEWYSFYKDGYYKD